jgi:cell fate (sporulation/competence/biofilm development) regulator YlbF (YheA/YmcA/DUF963 family)
LSNKTLKLLLHDAWKEKAPSQTRVFRLYKEFATAGSQDSFEDSERSGRKYTACTPENVDAVDQLIQENSHITLCEIEKELDISHGTIHTICIVPLEHLIKKTFLLFKFFSNENGMFLQEKQVSFTKN